MYAIFADEFGHEEHFTKELSARPDYHPLFGYAALAFPASEVTSFAQNFANLKFFVLRNSLHRPLDSEPQGLKYEQRRDFSKKYQHIDAYRIELKGIDIFSYGKSTSPAQRRAFRRNIRRVAQIFFHLLHQHSVEILYYGHEKKIPYAISASAPSCRSDCALLWRD